MDLPSALRHVRLTCRSSADEKAARAALRELLEPLDDELRAAVLRHAYWHEVEVPTAALAAVAGGHGALRAVAGRGPVIGSCRACGRAIRAVDRDSVSGDEGLGECQDCTAETAPARSVVAEPAPPWEFEPLPSPWRARPLPRMVAGRRQWAEDYPQRRPA